MAQSEPVDESKTRPKRTILTQILTCRVEGHTETEWMPRVGGLSGDVYGRSKFCEQCGKRLRTDTFRSNPKKSYVFVDRQWYPESLSCYEENYPEYTCSACGQLYEADREGHLRLQIINRETNHKATWNQSEHSANLCPACLDDVCSMLGIQPDVLSDGDSNQEGLESVTD